MSFHLNPTTGVAGKCRATVSCPFGDLDKDHYATAAEARIAYETSMAGRTVASAKTLSAPIHIKPTNLRFENLNRAGDFIEYDYDVARDCWTNGCDSICRCSTIENFEAIGWSSSDPNDIESFARSALGMPYSEPFPAELKAKLAPYRDFSKIKDDFLPIIENGYYGEELAGVEGADDVMKVLEDYYYSQPNAMGPHNILAFLRGKGYDTTGERPVEALKNFLRAENEDHVNLAVENADVFALRRVDFSTINARSKSRVKDAALDPRKPAPEKPSGFTHEISGIVVQDHRGYTLVDGYRRRAFYSTTKRKAGTYIVLGKASPWGVGEDWKR